ncbi:MAG TPA: sigma-70 family RNA polymerase sigma factor [Verrucomicrobiota bacterium]|nr:sigma-70 family RNA polymerase sigma factor [Verrucomicrobiota bacterium]
MTTHPSAAFAETRWTRVLASRGDSPEARAALGDLCEAYWDPVFRFLRREGRDEDAARELTQEFFARLLAGRGFAGAAPERGRFRSFLLGALKHFLADLRDHTRAAKRGGGVVPEPLAPATDTSSGLEVAAPDDASSTTYFDRQWAYAVMARALTAVENEFAEADRKEQFVVLKPWLVGDTAVLSQADAARRLALNEGAVKVAIHRLRKRFREVVRTEVAQTVPVVSDIDEELRYLVEVLSA